MRLHRRGVQADWEHVRSEHRNVWQRLAAATHGIVTPANFISVVGLALVLWGIGLVVHHHYLAGFMAILWGRLADVADGAVAEQTKTKSSLGEAVDVTLDKTAMFSLLLTLFVEHLVPTVMLVLITLQNLVNTIIGLTVKARQLDLQPSASGKITAALTWLCLLTFVGASAAGQAGWQSWHDLLTVVAYSLTVISLASGVQASREYIRGLLDLVKYGRRRALLSDLNRIIIVLNPQSSNVQRIEQRGRELSKLFPGQPLILVETSPQPADLIAKLRHALKGQPGRSLICIGGGDGTVNAVVNALMQLTPDVDLADTPVLPLWGGNANDFAYMLNGLSSRNSLRSVLGRGQSVAIYPFEVTVQGGDKGAATRRYAACYASFGATAYVAAGFNKPAAKAKAYPFIRGTLVALAREMAQVYRAILDAPSFDAEQGGQRVRIFEQTFVNGSRMGKVDRLPVKLNDRQFYRAVKSHKQPSFWAYVLIIIRGQRYGEVTDKAFTFTTKERAWAQFDGEATVLAENTTVTIGHAATPFYAVSTKLQPAEERQVKQTRRRRWRRIIWGVVGLLVIFHGWLYVTSPYSRWSIVQQPYTTRLVNGRLEVTRHYQLHAYSNALAQDLGYYKAGFLIILNNLSPSHLTSKRTVTQTLDRLHTLRFDPSKPYLISGDQYSMLYVRNLGVFYNALLDPRTARSQADWQHRQQIYLQSALYALDAFSACNTLTTTISPISPRSVVLTEVHPGSVPSDSLYGLLYALRQLSEPVAEAGSSEYQIQTIDATQTVLRERQSDLRRLLQLYLSEVQDPQTGLVRRHITLSGARDGVIRDSSFYDNVVLWKTLELANKLGIHHYSATYLDGLRQAIIRQYWDPASGIFSDEYRVSPGQPARFSADWLIALPTGFLQPANAQDRAKLTQIVAYTERNGLAAPLPIKYALANNTGHEPAIVRWFEPDYGGSAIWSYWGSQYITLLDQLQPVVSAPMAAHYRQLAATDLAAYANRIKRYGGFPETFKPDGAFLRTVFYKSILNTGWVEQFEQAEYDFQHPSTIGA